MSGFYKKIDELLTQALPSLNLYIKMSQILKNENHESVFLKAYDLCRNVKDINDEKKLRENYLITLHNDILQINNSLSHRNNPNTPEFHARIEKQVFDNKHNILDNAIKQECERINPFIERLDFYLNFFKQLNYFSDNIVGIGANGSGKTSLANHLRSDLSNNVVVVSAQRVLNIPTFTSMLNPAQTLQKLKATQGVDKSSKSAGAFNTVSSEFAVVIQNLLAESIAHAVEYRKLGSDASKRKEDIAPPSLTNLEMAFEIWNSLVEHRIIACDDGMNIMTRNGNIEYPIIQMSDGEKVILFLIAQVLQAPKNGFVIIDEPEMYLHKTIVKKLWDILEVKREDCIFVYLTHDLDFASSRTTAQKIWIKSFTPPTNWNMEVLPENELPETMLMELLGSRKNILFCEGEKDSLDKNIYTSLFPNFTIMYVSSCVSVINYTRAFNKLPNTHAKAYGILDSDFRDTDELQSLVEDSIYSFGVTEPENLFLDEEFLKLFNKKYDGDENTIMELKTSILKKFDMDMELQVSNYISSKVNHIFKTSHMQKGNTYKNVEDNFQNFNQCIKLEEWYEARTEEIKEIIQNKDYKSAIKKYNNKGLKSLANQHFRMSNFQDRAINLLRRMPEAQATILKYFPDALIMAHETVE